MRGIKINATMRQEVYINPAEAFEKITEALGLGRNHDGFVCVKDGQLMYGEDVSRHGSPTYKYKVMSDNPKWIELYKSVKCMEDYFKHSDEPQWDRMIEDENEMDEDNAPVMGM